MRKSGTVTLSTARRVTTIRRIGELKEEYVELVSTNQLLSTNVKLTRCIITITISAYRSFFVRESDASVSLGLPSLVTSAFEEFLALQGQQVSHQWSECVFLVWSLCESKRLSARSWFRSLGWSWPRCLRERVLPWCSLHSWLLSVRRMSSISGCTDLMPPGLVSAPGSCSH